MAERFKNFSLDLTLDEQLAYTCPENTTAIIILGFLANTSDIEVDAATYWKDFDKENKITYLLKNAPIPVGSTLNFLNGKFVLEEGDALYSYCSEIDSMQLTGSVFEIY
jgi:hypothetical protein